MIKIFTGSAVSVEQECNEWLLKKDNISNYRIYFTESQGDMGLCTSILIFYEESDSFRHTLRHNISDEIDHLYTYASQLETGLKSKKLNKQGLIEDIKFSIEKFRRVAKSLEKEVYEIIYHPRELMLYDFSEQSDTFDKMWRKYE